MRASRIVAVGGAVALALSIAAPAAPTPPAYDSTGRYRIRSERVGPGLTLLRIRDARGPNRIRVLKLNPDRSLTLQMELANDLIPDHETTSSMAARNGAVAAINGDYTLLPSDPAKGRPVHTFAHDSELVTSPLVWGRNFALTPDDQTVYIGHPKFRASLTQQDTGETWAIDAWNKVPASSDEITAYTMKGGYNHRPPHNACSTRLLPLDSPTLQADQINVVQTFYVDITKCTSRRMSRQGGVVLSAPWGSVEGDMMVASLLSGETVTLGWTTGWPQVIETIGGNPTLLENGLITAESCTDSYFCERNPRTGIGVDAMGKLLLVTVDGRQKDSVGMTPVAFARLFEWLGATSALNLDGGGSTTMWVRGRVVNRVSGAYERPVGSAILVVSETAPAPAPTPTETPAPTPTQLQGLEGETVLGEPIETRRVCAGLRDPGSTGGLLDYLESREPGRKFSGVLGRALDVYRGRATCASITSR
ncbi:MAG: phosphodiester glycosidase family protein [Actinomycetota bacterium]